MAELPHVKCSWQVTEATRALSYELQVAGHLGAASFGCRRLDNHIPRHRAARSRFHCRAIEALNSAVGKVCGLVHAEYSDDIKDIKDMAAAVASLGPVIVLFSRK